MEKLKLSEVKSELPFEVSRCYHIDWWDMLMRKRKETTFDFDVYLPTKGMNLQRPLVWDLHQKQQLILSILKDNPIPKVSIIIINDLKTIRCLKIQVIDGKQRMCAFIDFCENKFALPTGHTFDDLDKDCRMAIFRYFSGMDSCTLYNEDLTDEQKIMWFSQINFTGTPQDQSHLDELMADKK